MLYKHPQEIFVKLIKRGHCKDMQGAQSEHLCA